MSNNGFNLQHFILSLIDNKHLRKVIFNLAMKTYYTWYFIFDTMVKAYCTTARDPVKTMIYSGNWPKLSD